MRAAKLIAAPAADQRPLVAVSGRYHCLTQPAMFRVAASGQRVPQERAVVEEKKNTMAELLRGTAADALGPPPGCSVACSVGTPGVEMPMPVSVLARCSR